MTEEIVDSVEIGRIMELIPHRYPFLLIDRVIDIEPGASATGVKNVTMNENFFQGHFPGEPIMPGVLIVEAMAQTAGVLALLSDDVGTDPDGPPAKVYFMTISDARFRKPVVPGDVLHLKVEKDRSRGNVWRFKGAAYVGETLVAEAGFSAMVVADG